VTNPAVITYLGGAAGDMFAAGANGLEVDFLDREYVRRPPYSIKPLESQIVQGHLSLETVISDRSFDFVTTHIYEPLRLLRFPVISIVISDPQTIELTVLRQMKVQTLEIKVDPTETLYRLIKTSIDRGNWDRAARAWFSMAQKKWHQDRLYRLDNPLPGAMILNFDRLYHSDFVDSIRRQGFTTNLDLIEHNHSAWLERNLDHTLESTLHSMIKKIQRMDWSQQQGYVVYDQP
jgi:hypothetical protein